MRILRGVCRAFSSLEKRRAIAKGKPYILYISEVNGRKIDHPHFWHKCVLLFMRACTKVRFFVGAKLSFHLCQSLSWISEYKWNHQLRHNARRWSPSHNTSWRYTYVYPCVMGTLGRTHLRVDAALRFFFCIFLHDIITISIMLRVAYTSSNPI